MLSTQIIRSMRIGGDEFGKENGQAGRLGVDHGTVVDFWDVNRALISSALECQAS